MHKELLDELMDARLQFSLRDCERVNTPNVTLSGSLIELRAKGLRSREVLDLAAVYGVAVRARLALEKAERAARRKGKRAGK